MDSLNKLTKRQIEIFKIIVTQYINNATPVASKEIATKFMTDIGSATIRNEMAILEKHNLIEKTHTSSGRVPSKLGYKFYQDNILQSNISDDLKHALKKIFSKRLSSIENIIEESVALINETLHLPSIVTTDESNELLKRIDLIPIHANLAIVLIVTSSGNIIKNTITFKDKNIIYDLSTCVRVFNDRLVDTPLKELKEKLISIKPLIKISVENYEFILQEMFYNIFNTKQAFKTHISGAQYLISQPEFKNDYQKLKQTLELLDNTTIWQQIAYQQSKTGKTTLITNGDQFGKNYLSIASTIIKDKNTSHQIAILGPNRMDFAKVKGIFEFLKSELEKRFID